MKAKKRIGLLFKMVGISSALMLTAILVLAFVSIRSVETSSLNTAIHMGNYKLAGDIATFQYKIAQEHGQLRLVDGTLVDSNGNSLRHDFRLVDMVASSQGVQATIFVLENRDFLRITTSIVDNAGRRVVDTFLGQDHAAFNYIISGMNYSGLAVILGRDFLTAYQPIFAPNTNEVIGSLFIGIEMSSIEETIISARNTQIIIIVIAAVIILFLSVLLIVVSCRFILLKPIQSVMGLLKSMGEGDLTKQLSVKNNDEIGEMVESANITMKKISSLIANIRKEVEVLSGIGVDLTSNMNQTASTMNEITANTQNAKERALNQSASVSETHATMNNLVTNINKLDKHIENQSRNISKASSAIEEMAANIKSVNATLLVNADSVNTLTNASEVGRASLAEVSTDIQEIARESESLLQINAVMKNIASQTNLLSMNAAIEAAHAGDAGRGFAVVANEIRKLAENSSEQSKTISMALKKMKSSIDKITFSTGNVLTRFEAIDSNVRTVSIQEENIRSAMEEQEVSSREILGGTNELNEITQQVKSSSNEMLDGAKEVIRESENLEKVTQEITSGMNEMAVGTEHINLAINHVNDLSNKMREGIDILEKEVSRFKV